MLSVIPTIKLNNAFENSVGIRLWTGSEILVVRIYSLWDCKMDFASSGSVC